MFGIVYSDVAQSIKALWDAQVRVWAGLAFMILAMAAIQYEEFIAPEVSRISDTFGTAATDMGRRISSLTL